MSSRPRVTHPFRLALCILGASLAPAIASAQTIRIFQDPLRPGERFAFRADLPDSWGVQGITVDPLGYGLNSFLVRLSRNPLECPAGETCWNGFLTLDDHLQPGDRTLTLMIDVGGGRTRTLATTMHIAAALDEDHDGMPDVWERREGLEPFDRLGTSAPGDDPDHDGVSNIDEFRAGTAPMGRYHLLFGSSSPGDRQGMAPGVEAIQPDSLAGPIRVRFIGDDGRQLIPPVYAEGPEVIGTSFPLYENVADRVLAIEVDSYHPLAAERELSGFPVGFYSAVQPAALSTDWHFPTGPTSHTVDAFLLAYNPGSAPVAARFTYYRSADEAPAVEERVLGPGRTTIWINADESALSGRDYAVAISAAAPILMDRGFRWQAPGRTAPQEQTGPGITAPAAQWYFPRVGTQPGGNDQLVLANPGDRDGTVEVAAFGQRGDPRVSYVTVRAHARLAVDAGTLGNDMFSGVRLVTVNGTPFVAELMRESVTRNGDVVSTIPGATETGTTWAMGLHSGGHITIFNPSDEDASVEVTAWYTPTYGTAAVHRTVRAPAKRLTLVSLWDDPYKQGDAQEISGQTATVRSLPRADGTPGPAIVVGRAGWAGALGTQKALFEPTLAVRVR